MADDNGTQPQEDPEVTRQRLQALANKATSSDPAGGQIQVTPTMPHPLDPAVAAQRKAAFQASGGTPAEQRGPPPAAGGAAGRLGDAWNTFIDHPENRAGMMQFAVNMLAGRGLGESVGAAAEATGRNVDTQEARQKAEEEEALKIQEAARKERETEYYGIGQRKAGGAEERYFSHLDAQEASRARAQVGTEYLKWKNDLAPDATWGQVVAKYPDLKEKGKKGMNQEQEAYARSLIASGLGYGGPTERGAGAAMQGRGGGGGPTPVYDKNTGALKGYWDGKKFTPGEPPG